MMGEAGSSASGADRIVTARVGGVLIGLDLDRVVEFIEPPPIVPVPSQPPHVLGIVSVRGAIVPVVDCRRRLGLTTSPVAPPLLALVRQGDTTIGLTIDELGGLVEPASRSHGAPNEEAPFLRYIIADETGQAVHVIDLARFLGASARS